jgi:hypothetical protein
MSAPHNIEKMLSLLMELKNEEGFSEMMNTVFNQAIEVVEEGIKTSISIVRQQLLTDKESNIVALKEETSIHVREVLIKDLESIEVRLKRIEDFLIRRENTISIVGIKT